MRYRRSWGIPVLASSTIFFLATIASATPSIEPKCKFESTDRPKTPKSGAGVMFDDDCTTAYVNPPINGEVSVAALAQNANLQFCPSVLGVNDVVKSTLDGAREMDKKILKMIQDFDPISEAVQALSGKASAASARKVEAESKLEVASRKKTELKDALRIAKSSYEDCALLRSQAECATVAAALEDAKATYKKHVTDVYGPAESAAIEAKAAHDQAFVDYTSKTRKLAEALEPLFELQKKLFEVQQSVFQLYTQYAALEGATGQLTYRVQWDKLLQEYQALNPGLPVTWQPMPIKSARFSATARIAATPTSIPAVLSAQIPGMPPFGPANLPTGNGQVEPAPTVPSGADLGQRSIGFGTSVSGQIVLSLAGACPYFPNGIDTSAGALSNIDVRQLAAHMVANAWYTYEVKAHRSYHARYNMESWMSRIERNVKKGGFFSSKTLHDVVEDGRSTDWFNIRFDEQAGEAVYTPEEKVRITKEVKAQLQERGLKLIAIQNGFFQGPPQVPGLAPTGAGAAASYLMSGCGSFSWCTAGGWILGTLDSIFGRSEAVSNFKRANHAAVTEDVDDVVILERNGSFTFVP